MGLFDAARQQAAALTPTTTTAAPIDGLAVFSGAAAPTGTVDVTLGVQPMPHQQVVLEAVEKGYRSLLIADQMGVGKTLSAIGSMEAAGAFPCLLIVPPTLTINWQREIRAALPHRTTSILSGKKAGVIPSVDIVICPDSIVDSWAMQPDPSDKRRKVASGPLGVHPWRGLVVDEAHRLKNEKAQRTGAVVKISRNLPKDSLRLLLSGTPLVNRPDELVAPLAILGVLNTVFGSRARFLGRYCEFDGWGSVVGSRNGKELWERLTSTVMIRRLREQVLTLPSKQRLLQRTTMSAKAAADYQRAENNLVSFLRHEKGDREYNISERAEAIVLLNTLRQISGKAKIDAAVAEAERLLAQGEQVFLAATHIDVVAGLWRGLHQHGVVQVVGGMSVEAKQDAVDQFQSGKAKVLVGNIEAAGVGITLTAARHIIVVELPWNPAALQQVEDRLHRIGQKREVTSTILISEWSGGSVDERLWSLIDKKAQTVNEILDGLDEGMVVDNDEAISQQLLDSYR